MRKQNGQGNVEMEEDMLKHIIDFLAVFEKDPNVAHEWAVVTTHQELKGALIACLSLPNQDAIRDVLPL